MGDRPTEIAIAWVEDGRIVDRFQSLMNPGRRIPAFATQLTGITNAMVATAPAVETVMREAARFVGSLPVVAHNASFDRKFWTVELRRLVLDANASSACTMLLARCLYPECSSHKLGALVEALQRPRSGRAHRATSGHRDGQPPVVPHPCRCGSPLGRKQTSPTRS
jgi:DNA polymerase-3 subunit epsilon